MSVLLIVAGLILLIAPVSWFPSFYAVRFMGFGAIVFAGLILLPELLFHPKTYEEARARENLQMHIAVSIALSGAGELGLWQLYLVGFEYDKVVHILIPALLVFSLSSFLHVWYQLSWKKTIAGVALGVIAASLGWEAIEFYSDRIFGTQLFGVYGQNISRDTIIDIICDIVGIGFSAMLLGRRPPVL